MSIMVRRVLMALAVGGLTLGTPAALLAQEVAPGAAEAQPLEVSPPATPDTEGTDGVAGDVATPGAEAAVAEVAEVPVAHAPIPFFSLFNTNFVVLIAFLVFVGVLLYMKVPGTLGGLLDKRTANIRRELDEARKMRDEAQALLVSYERRQMDVREQAERIVAAAKADAAAAAEKAKADLKVTIARRLKAAEEQIAAEQAAAIREVRNRAAEIAVAVAGKILAGQMDAARANALVDDAIASVREKLH